MTKARTEQPTEPTEDELADFLWEQIEADEAGTLPPEHRAKLDQAAPGWDDPEYREQQRLIRELAQVHTEQEMDDFWWKQFEAADAGTMSPYRRAWFDEQVAEFNRITQEEAERS